MTHLPILFGYNVDGIGNSSIPLAFCRFWNEAGFSSTLYAPSSNNEIQFPWLKNAMGKIQKKFVYRFAKERNPQHLVEKYCLKNESNTPYVYLWAGLSLDIFEKFHSQGVSIITERINCHQATARAILDAAYAQMELPPDHSISDESIASEKRKLELADAIFCPSPMVYKSMLANGVLKEKLLQTSYGWSPERFPGLKSFSRGNGKPTFLFVGTLCVRKGVPLLLEAWDKANIDGNLVFCGTMDDTIKKHFGHFFEREDIVHIPFTKDIGHYYNLADAFVFPTLEEGGPMVTYEAMAHGVVPLVSAMGAGSIVQDKKNGLILPDTVEAWSTAIMAISQQSAKQMEFAQQARKRALEFTWKKVAAHRASLLQKRFPSLWGGVTG
jgi:glycosyltransferase involved in cell wall biosynthesis